MTNLLNQPLPMTIEEIDRDWLTAALRTRVPDAAVNSFEISRMIRGACTKIFYNLDLNDAAKEAGIPEKVMLKGGFEPHSRDMKVMQYYEALAYGEIFPALKLHTPGCYFADYDDSLAQGIVIMDDLTTRGVTFCDPLKPQSYEQVARRLTAFAQYHAKTWDSPEFEPGGRWSDVPPPRFNFEYYIERTLQPEVWNRFLGLPRGAASSVHFHDAAWMHDALETVYAFNSTVPQAIIHGDSHLNNLFVEKDGTPGFFDFLPTRSPPMQEISYHMTCALDIADRRRWQAPLVSHYLDELRRCGVDAPSFDEAMRQYGIFLTWGFAVWLLNEPVFQTEAVNTACAARFSAALIDNDTKSKVAALN